MPVFDIFKKKSKNKQNIDEHTKKLIKDYTEYASQITKLTNNVFQDFHHRELFLCHLSTGYESTYSLLLEYISLRHEIDNKIMAEPIWKEKTKVADNTIHEFKHQLDKLLVKIERGSEVFEGICIECKKWHEDDEHAQLISKLNLFKMPQ